MAHFGGFARERKYMCRGVETKMGRGRKGKHKACPYAAWGRLNSAPKASMSLRCRSEE